jgi:hypothetical protein
MEIDIFCDKCKSTEKVFHSPKTTEKNGNPLGIPIPQSGNGLFTYSIVHSNHTLIIDVDHEGNVRGEKYIERIDRRIEEIISVAATRLLNVLRKPGKNISVFFISENQILKNLLLGVFQQLILNIPKDFESLLSVKNGEVFFEYGHMLVYVGLYDKKIHNFFTDQPVIAFELTHNNYNSVTTSINNIKKVCNEIDFAILFGKSLLDKDAKDKIMLLGELYQIFTFYEISNLEKSAITLFQLIDQLSQ